MLGVNIKAMREKRGFTQEQFAEKIGVNRVNLAYFESGKKVPSLAVAERIADELDCSLDWLLGRKEHCNGCQMDKDCH